MKAFVTLLALLLTALLSSSAHASNSGGLDETINAVFAPVANAIFAVVFYPIPLGSGASMPAMLLWLTVAAIFFTVYFGFINVRGFGQGFRLIRGDSTATCRACAPVPSAATAGRSCRRRA